MRIFIESMRRTLGGAGFGARAVKVVFVPDTGKPVVVRR